MSNKKKKYLGAAKTKYNTSGCGKESIRVADNGYTAICPHCTARHSLNEKLIGYDRYLDFKVCISPSCQTVTPGRFEKYYRTPTL